MPLRPRHLLLAAVVLLAACSPEAHVTVAPTYSAPAAVTTQRPSAALVPPPPVITYPAAGHRKWTTAPAQSGKPAGRSGQLLRYRILVEKDIDGLDVTAFANAVTTTLSDPRSWTAGGTYRLQRVGPGQFFNFTIYLATPETKDTLCLGRADGYTSCRADDNVVLNVARWAKGAAAFKGSLATYRRYMVNHEVGHRLGQGHMLCPGKGDPAPVMQQQTLGMHGCTANAWPYPDKKHFYPGRSGAYNDPVPPADNGKSS